MSSAYSSTPRQARSVPYQPSLAPSELDTSNGGVAVDHLGTSTEDSRKISDPVLEPVREDMERKLRLGVAALQSSPPQPLKRSAAPIPNLPDTVRAAKSVWNTTKGSGSMQSGTPASQRLFPHAKANPPLTSAPALKGATIARASPGLEKHTQAASTGYESLMNTRFWTPRSDTWDPERFFNSMLQSYECPMLGCNFVETSPTALSDHCMDFHKADVFSCPSCLHEYKSIADLVTHCEKVSAKCKVNQRRDFPEVISRISGGYLDAITNAEDGTIKYKGAIPAEWEDKVKAVR